MASDEAKAGKYVHLYPCFYCRKVFKSHQALGGHLRAHQIELNQRRALASPGQSSNSADKPNPLSACHGSSSPSAGSNVALTSGGTSPLAFNNSFCSNKNGFGGINPLVSPSLHYLSGSVSAEKHYFGGLTTQGSNGIQQFNTYESQAWQGAFPFSSWQKFRGYYPNDFFSPSFTVPETVKTSVSSLSPGLNESSAVGSFSQGSFACQNEIGQCSKGNALSVERGKRPYVDGVPGNSDAVDASKRQKAISDLPMKMGGPEHKELLLFDDVENYFSELGMCNNAENKEEIDIDLSLHL